MSSMMDSVNQRTQLVGQNRLELLLFRLNGPQLYGINVFKVREVLQCPNLTLLPKSNPIVRGIASVRGRTIPVIDLSLAIGRDEHESLHDGFVIIAEYNMMEQGFLVGAVERIINLNWEEIHPPPKGTGRDHYLTAVTRFDDQLIEVIDVEKILAEVSPAPEEVSGDALTEQLRISALNKKILIVDDSSVARKQVLRCLQALGVAVIALNDGRSAYEYLKGMLSEGRDPATELLMLISDIEMPEMDGYTLTAEIRNDARLKDLYILLHSSLSGVFNEVMVKKVGANDFLAKFRPDDLVDRVVERIKVVDGL
ncbi:MAG: chemotaxis protein CheV [Gammaproteobacteria bacterium]|nr:chemotaxis protein CheV [Gammaproteobacteria bacterium]